MKIIEVAKIFTLDFPFVDVQDQQGKFKPVQDVPTRVFQTWETNRVGKRHAESIRLFREKNSNLDFYLFDRAARDDYMIKNWGDRVIGEVYFRSQFGALRADIFRYCITHHLGGYYFDISKGLDTRITDLHSRSAKAVISFESNLSPFSGPRGLDFPNNLVVQWGFGFARGHPILSNQINRIENFHQDYLGKVFRSPKQAILEFTGPIAFTKSVHEHVATLGTNEIIQLGIDFLGHGIFSLRGSSSRYLISKSYAEVSNRAILL